MNRVCGKCKIEKDVSDFHKKKDGYQDKCKDCSKEYHRKHYLRNKDTYIKQAQQRRENNKKFVWELKSRNSCKDCGKSYHPCVMEFDHRDRLEKEDCVGKMVRNGCSKKKILSEISKCDLVCANCHRLRTIEVWQAEFWSTGGN